ncbi:M28 family peptidase [Terrimonas sp. NA20]|uniref:M28 family peptidase n=1 Tax=Terrimonas ginsenosidimutans TaxID=2908004 RepID=A0ABS9KQ06_9BACT|nr:M28 family peptidase [Terrimonas ginsenosidimutans]MCG2614402.1 M28 family peptidase [Terrimonas ginsenosidimutans]
MRKIVFSSVLLTVATVSFSQNIDKIINAKEAERIERVLASDEMRGRRTFSPEIDKAADFIAAEFKAAGLETWKGSGSYLQKFALIGTKQTSLSATLDGKPIDAKNVAVSTTQAEVKVTPASGYEVGSIAAGANFNVEYPKLVQSGKNMIIYIDPSFANIFTRVSSSLRRAAFKKENNIVLILDSKPASDFLIEAKFELTEQPLANVVGVLPGKSKKDEYVIFSGHYDHIGIGKPVNGDSIYNGANDDAAGTTGVMLLAKYYKELKNNERTIVFAAFTGEEVGMYGSTYFSKQFDPAKVVAMFNLEMIGTESKWGKNSAYITGYDKTDMGTILQKNLEGTGFTFYPDPYTEQQLFYRSDNATLARLGVPAHTISTSKMDVEPHYHKVSDHVETLDMANMAMVIKSIALSARSIVAGKDTPSRVKTEDLR